MPADLLLNLEQYIPVILRFYIPGFIFLNLISVTFVDKQEYQTGFALEILISWFFNIFVSWLNSFIDSQLQIDIDQEWIQLLALIALSLLFAYLYIILRKYVGQRSWGIKKILGFTRGNIIHDLKSNKSHKNVEVLLRSANDKELRITGQIGIFDNLSDPRFIAIYHYKKYEDDEEKDFLKEYILLPLDQVVYMRFIKDITDGSTDKNGIYIFGRFIQLVKSKLNCMK